MVSVLTCSMSVCSLPMNPMKSQTHAALHDSQCDSGFSALKEVCFGNDAYIAPNLSHTFLLAVLRGQLA